MEIYQRWNIHHRLQHFLLFISFFILTFTGLPIKYATKTWAVGATSILGGFDTMLFIHKAAALVMIVAAIYHLVYLFYFKIFKKQSSSAMIPTFKDFTDLLDHIIYCLGWGKEDAKFDRYSYKEKFDYWAVFWGIAIMVGSGLMMWFPHITARFVPRWVIDCAQIAHSDEAMLAITAVFIWHFYNVHFSPFVFPMSLVWLNGQTNQIEMAEFHPGEMEKAAPPRVDLPMQTEVSVSKAAGRWSFRDSRWFILLQMLIYGTVLVWFLSVFLPLGLK